jgi:hypothetical protein
MSPSIGASRKSLRADEYKVLPDSVFKSCGDDVVANSIKREIIELFARLKKRIENTILMTTPWNVIWSKNNDSKIKIRFSIT